MRRAALVAVAALTATSPASALAKDGGAGAFDPLRPTTSASSIARIVRPTLAHVRPSGGSPVRATVRPQGDWVGGPVGLLVLGSRVGDGGRTWLRVLLPGRPNESSAWVDRDAVKLSRTGWRVVVTLATRRLTVLHDGRLMRSSRVVVGAAATPTPRGLFAVYERVRQPRGAVIGPWALHLTAHSRVLHSYDGGPGRIALHGRAGGLLLDPLGSARSHGCVRMPSALVAWLARRVVPGTPVEIR